jgi:hypothetical protein
VTPGWTASLQYDAWDDGRLVLHNAPVDGNYGIDISVTAASPSGASTTRRQQLRQILVSGQEVVWDDDYYRAVEGCLDQLSDLAEEIGREGPPVRRLPGIGPRPGLERIRLDRAASAYTRLKSRDAARAAELERLVALRYGVSIALDD